jgi:cytochrome c553
MLRKTVSLAMASVIGLALSGIAGAADIHTQSITSTCMSCHGPGGKSRGAIPSLAGLEKGYFVKAMQDFKSGARPSTIMKRHASGYTDAEFEAMGAYFAGLK